MKHIVRYIDIKKNPYDYHDIDFNHISQPFVSYCKYFTLWLTIQVALFT